jgi:diguanylate cyclase (GGDEF)-like protein/PAS domain S-box-containing protein
VPVRGDAPCASRPASEVASLKAENVRLEQRVRELEGAAGESAAAFRRCLAQFADTTAGWFWEMDADLRFTYFSPSVEGITGVAPEWHYGKTREELGIPSSVSAQAWAEHLDTLARREPFRDFVFRRDGPDGVKWMQTSGSPVFDSRGRFRGYRGTATDVTHRMQVEKALADERRLLETAFGTIPDGVQVLNEELELVAWNSRLWEVMELDEESILSSPDPGKAFRYALARRGEYGPGDVDELVASREGIARTPVAVQYERQLVSGRWIECRGTPIPGGGYMALYRDIDDSKRLQSELERLAAFDELTGLGNRRHLLQTMEQEFERARRYARPLALMVIDVDHFKAVNDRHGHAAGDLVLQRLSAAFVEALRETDRVGRLGGEEFAAVLPESNVEQARNAAERVRAAVAALRVPHDGAVISPTVSIGVAEVRPGHDVQQVLARADEALYAAKRDGRNRVVTCDDA